MTNFPFEYSGGEEIDDLGGDIPELEGGDDELGGWSLGRQLFGSGGKKPSAARMLYDPIGYAIAKRKFDVTQGQQRKQQQAQRQAEASRGQMEMNVPRQQKLVGNPNAIATMAPSGGCRFMRAAGATITIAPIPLEARVPSGVGRQMLRQAAVVVPAAPLTGAVTVAGAGPWDATIRHPDALLATAHQLGTKSELKFALIRIDFGLPGLTAAAGSQITFSVFTQQLLPLPVVTPEPVDSVDGAFNSGDITITPLKVNEVSSVVLIPWRIQQAQPLPRLARIDWAGWGPLGPPLANQEHALVTRVFAAPAGTTATMTLVTPTHPSWQTIAKELGLGSDL